MGNLKDYETEVRLMKLQGFQEWEATFRTFLNLGFSVPKIARGWLGLWAKFEECNFGTLRISDEAMRDLIAGTKFSFQRGDSFMKVLIFFDGKPYGYIGKTPYAHLHTLCVDDLDRKLFGILKSWEAIYRQETRDQAEVSRRELAENRTRAVEQLGLTSVPKEIPKQAASD